MVEKESTPSVESLAEKITSLEARLKELQEENDRLKELATKDTLTGLNNRRGFLELFDEIVPDEKGKREKTDSPHRLALLIADIDNFKEINDTYGHNEGDRVLKETAEFLAGSVRKKDVVGRLGGEEFAIAFHGADAQDIINKFFNRDEKRAEMSFETELGGKKTTITISGGVTDVVPGENFDSAMRRADRVLYEAKESGRNRILRHEE